MLGRRNPEARRSRLRLPTVILGLALVGICASLSTGVAGARTQKTTATPAATNKVNVTFSASAVTFSKASANAGTVVFTLINKDAAARNLTIAGKKSPQVAPKAKKTWSVTLDKPGRFIYKSGTAKGSFAILPATDAMANLIAAAKKEGSVTFYTAIPTSTSQPFADAFTAKYGIKVDLFNSSTIADRYSAERDVSTVNADIINTTDPAFYDDGTQKGWFVTLTPALVPNIGVIPGKFFRLHTYAVVSIQSVGIAYNTQLVNPPPTSWEDLLQPRFQGHILLTDPSLIIPWLCTYKLWQDHLAPGFLQKLAAQNPQFVSSSNPGAQQLAAGNVWVNTPSSPRALVAVQAQGAPVAYVVPKPTTLQESAMAISTKAPHPNAARLFMDYTLSPEGQQQLNKDTAISVLPNIPGTLAMPDDYFLPDAIGAQRQKAQLLAPFGR